MITYRLSPLKELLALFFPPRCVVCGCELVGDEHDLCTHCLLHLPATGYAASQGNDTEMRLIGKVPFCAASSLLYFAQGNAAQRVVHAVKYHGNKDLGFKMGMLLGGELKKSGRFDHIDAVVPVPLHWRRQWSRGYNQSALLARGIAEMLGCDLYEHAVRRIRYTDTQTRKSRLERIENIKSAFVVPDADLLKGKHLLVVDDVITTGTTICECAKALAAVEGVQLSFASLVLAL